MLSEVEHGVLEGFLQSLLVRAVCLEPRLDERTFEATAVGLSEGKSFVLCHVFNELVTPHHSISSSWIRKLCVSCSSSFHTLSNHTPWSSGAPITWDAVNPHSCSALTAFSHCSCVMFIGQ